jgi:type IV secretory pathway VirB4 component
VSRPPPAHRLTTAHLGAAYPFVAEGGLGTPGVYVGRDLLGGAFSYDPFALYASGALTNPNMVVMGQIGRGKSALVKSYLWRQAAFGRGAWIVDPKGEYGVLGRLHGVAPVKLSPGGGVRLNPLDLVAASGRQVEGEGSRRGAQLLASLSEASLGRSLRPAERTALELAVEGVAVAGGVPTVPRAVTAMLDPAPEAARSVRTTKEELAADGREVALELRRLVHGDLRGMFDGPTTPRIDMGARIVVLDLSAVYDSGALGILMTCAAAWLQAALVGERSGPRIVVVDEAWAILTHLGIARWLRSSWKLARALGVAHVAVLHRVSDLRSTGAEGSETLALAQGLLADSETRVVYAQPPGELAGTADALGLSSTEVSLLPRLGRAIALWKVGQRSFLVEHRLAPGERALVDTDSRMVER